jgi:hypothetical protein
LFGTLQITTRKVWYGRLSDFCLPRTHSRESFGSRPPERPGPARFGPAQIGPARPGPARSRLAGWNHALGSPQASQAARLGSARPGLARLGPARLGPARLGSARLGSARPGSARPGPDPHTLAPLRIELGLGLNAPCSHSKARVTLPGSLKVRLTHLHARCWSAP